MLLVYWWPEISRYPSETRTLTQWCYIVCDRIALWHEWGGRE
jgi:hypothetical protein